MKCAYSQCTRPLQELLDKYCCQCCCKCWGRLFGEKKISPEERREEETTKKATKPVKQVSDSVYVKQFVREWERDKFWPNLWGNLTNEKVKYRAATQVQRMIRGHLDRKVYDKLLTAALAEMNSFWNDKRANKLLAKELKRIERETRANFAMNLARNTLSQCVSRKARRDAAMTIQRAWRGMVGRSIASYFMMLASQLRPKKQRPPPSRFRSDVLRRIWARKSFEPEGGWPGKMDFVDFDMWEHDYVPPKGNTYGLKTHKIRGAPQTKREKDLLLRDKNAWVGFPVDIMTAEEAKKPIPDRILEFRHTSPYRVPVIAHDDTLHAPKRLTGLQTLYALGWKNPLQEEKKRNEKTSNFSTGVFKASRTTSPIKKGKSNDPILDNESVSIQPRAIAQARVRSAELASSVPLPITLNGSLARSQGEYIGVSQVVDSPTKSNSLESKTFQGPGREVVSPQRGAVKPVVGQPIAIGPLTEELASGKRSIQALARAEEKKLLHLTQDNPTYLPVHHQGIASGNRYFRDVSTNSPRPVGDQLKSASSAWQKLRSDVSTITYGTKTRSDISSRHPMGEFGVHMPREDRLEKRTRPWPVKPRRYFKLQYSWLPEHMVQEAAAEIYTDDAELIRQKQVEEEAALHAKKKKLPFLVQLQAYNTDDVSTISTLTGLREFERKTALSIRDERLRAEPLNHPYPWVT